MLGSQIRARNAEKRATRAGGLALLAAAAAVALAGCGGSKSPPVASAGATTSSSTAGSANAGSGSGTTSSGPSSQVTLQSAALKYARCMRAHGVPSFPDPNAGGGFSFSPGGGVDPSSPAFEAAQAKCGTLLGGLTPGAQTHPSAQWLAKMVKAAQCMRRHGVPDFPDPTTSVPSPAVLGKGSGVISNIDGAVFAFPAATVDTQSPAFIQAAKTCGFPLHNH